MLLYTKCQSINDIIRQVMTNGNAGCVTGYTLEKLDVRCLCLSDRVKLMSINFIVVLYMIFCLSA